MQPQYVPEVDVLIEAVKWLNSGGWAIETLSIAHGAGIDSVNNRKRVEAEMT